MFSQPNSVYIPFDGGYHCFLQKWSKMVKIETKKKSAGQALKCSDLLQATQKVPELSLLLLV